MARKAMTVQNYINHIALVLDASGSMSRQAASVVKVADAQIAYLAQRSKELDQETRITVYTFSDDVECLIYDKDVLRMPSIAAFYRADGQTALIDATLKALTDLAKTPELYGEHAFLTYVLTDGQENHSRNIPAELVRRIEALPDHWTLATFVPDQVGVMEAKRFGFPKDNIAVWDTRSQHGVESVGERIRQTTEQFMQNRTKGIRGSRNLFALDTKALDKKAALKGLDKLHPGQYRVLKVDRDVAIAPFIETQTGRAYQRGECFYQLMKPETVQAQKDVVLYEKATHYVYTGAKTRSLLGLPDHEVRVEPAAHPKYDVFVQSTSVNRKLIHGTRVLLLS